MSDFAALKRQRSAKETRSFVSTKIPPSFSNVDGEDSSSNMDVDQSDQTTATPLGLNSNGLYASIPPSLEVRESQDKGRGLYSKHARKPGDVLLSVKPHVAALSVAKLEGYCSNCFGAKKNSLQRCTGCKVVYYCDSKCQNKDWAFHKHECTAIQRWSASAKSSNANEPVIPADAIRCLARIVWRKQKLGLDSIWAKEIDALQSHRTSLSKDPNAQDSQMYAQLAHALVNFLGLTSPQDMAEYGMQNAADLVDLISRLTTNTFTVSTPSLEPLGACVSPTVALINHSCDPNAVVVFPRAGGEARKLDEPLMQVIALKYIAADDEILTSYIDTTLPRERRQKILRETYHFTCNCTLCAPPPDAPIDFREAMWCPKKCGGVCPLPTEENSFTRCARCKAPVKDTDAVLDAVRVGQEGLDKAEALQISDPEKSIQLTTKLVPILISAGLMQGSHPLLALARLNASLLITHLPSAPDPSVEEIHSPGVQQSSTPIRRQEAQEALDEAIRAATRASAGLAQVLVEGHPVRGVALAEVGKLLCVDEPNPAHVRDPDSGAPSSSSSPSGTSTPRMNVATPAPYPPSGPPRLKLAYETLLRGRAELVIGFGGGKNDGGEVGRDVRALLVDLEKEMAVWKNGVRNVMEDKARLRVGGRK
ncbi:SET domain-containing protein [Pholiota conissans]|uniref:SET domain-containing protein n=1 Tax=Pholiota conissans TaxID=109636 RepID=A0A9P5YVS2_9AGAR|nr:SET domain-containing protein [Pholiota conissans]